MKKIFSKELTIGLVVLISLVVLFVGIEFLKGVNVFKPSNYYVARYTNVMGLAVSAPVTINGFQVGLVREIGYDYNKNGEIIVEFSLDNNIKLPKGTVAAVGADMLGTASIQLLLSQSDEFYTSGDEILSKTQLGIMDALGNSLMPALTELLPKIDSIVSGVNVLVNNPALNTSISRLDKISQNLEQTTTALNKMMSGTVPSTMGNVEEISKNLISISGDLKEVSTTLKQMPIDSIMGSVNATAVNLKTATDQLNSNESTIGLLLNDKTLYNHLDTTLGNVDSLLIDLKRNPKKYVNFKLF